VELIERVREVLNGIVDPCSVAAGAPAGLVELGLIREVTLEPGPAGAAVRVVIGLTEPLCMMGGSFVARARELLAAVPGVSEVDVSLDDAGDWGPGDIDPGYRLRLAAVRSARTTS
jgi:metal-sulfur cluster biosynthetic enzyme